MDITVKPSRLRGSIAIIPSKSQAHRLLICAAFADNPTQLICPETNRDIEATADCLTALGAKIIRTETGYTIFPVKEIPQNAILNCCESGSTLRFLLPVAGALGIDATFLMEGRLPMRPLSPLWEEMERMGCTLTRPTANTIFCNGKLIPGSYFIDGSVSSQYITGLLLGLSLLEQKSTLDITGKLESAPYVEMTKEALTLFGGRPNQLGGERLHSPGDITVEGDWSNGAFFVVANALYSSRSTGDSLLITGLNTESTQGDRAVVDILQQLAKGMPTISAADIPDLVPILSVAAAHWHGAFFTETRRLRLKESDRVASVIALITALGGKADATENTLTIYGTGLRGGIVDSFNDHRIAMSAAVAATICKEPVTIRGVECVKKSYPKFFEEYSRLGGNYEQHLR